MCLWKYQIFYIQIVLGRCNSLYKEDNPEGGLSSFSDEIFIYPGVTSRSLWLVSEALSRRLIAFHILDSVSCNSPNKTDLVAPTVCLSTVHLQYIS